MLQICTRINRVMKNKLSHCNFRIVFKINVSLSMLSHSKIKFLFSYVLALFINLSVVAAKLPIMAKLSAILKSECLNILEFGGDSNSAVKAHHSFCNHSSGFDDFSILVSNNNDFKVTFMESLLINRDHPPLNKNRHSLPLELFDDWGK